MVNIIDREREFLVVNHSYLNGNGYNTIDVVERGKKLEQFLNGRKAVICLEGDLIQVEETGEPVFTHQSFVKLGLSKFRKLREHKLASPLDEVLDKYEKFEREINERLVLCIEPKLITSKETLRRVYKELAKRNIRDVYFDSFYGNNLDDLCDLNNETGLDFDRSYYMLLGNIGSFKFTFPFVSPKQGYDIISSQYMLSFGKVEIPIIYGAVGSLDNFKIVAETPNCIGAYVRFKEGTGLKGMVKMFVKSALNTKGIRG